MIHYLDNLENGFGGKCSSSLSIMPSFNNSVEQLAAFTELHYQIDGLFIFKGRNIRDNVWMFGQMSHNLDLPPNIVHVDFRPELRLGYLLAGNILPCFLVEALVCNAELPSPEL